MQPKIHPVANIFPMMDAESFERLKADIAENGQRESTVYWRKMLVDGRNRDKACRELGIEPHECELDDDADPVAFVLSANLHRRHLTISQNAICAARLATLPNHRPDKSPEMGTYTTDAAAAMFNVGRGTVENARRVVNYGCEALILLCESGELKVTPAADFVAAFPDKKRQAAICKQGVEAIEAATKKAKDQPKEPQPEIVEPAKDVVHEVCDADAEVQVDDEPEPAAKTEPKKRNTEPKAEPSEVVDPACYDLGDPPNDLTVGWLDRFLQEYDDRPYFERFKVVWDAADATGRAAIKAFVMGGD